MADEEIVNKLRQGAEEWHRFLRWNPKLELDLREAYLSNAELSRVDLCRADLSKSDLGKANLSGADLSEADVSGADLGWANLERAILSHVNLAGANLSGANLKDSFLNEGNLHEANLSKATLNEANLSKADLSGADLNETDLNGAIIKGANLSNTDLSGRDFTGIDLSGIYFKNTNLQRACLINANLDGADLSGASLWETQRAGWSIKNVICEYIYWDKEANEKTIYEPGEFERLFANQTKIKLLFKGGITPLEIATLPALIQHLEDVKGCSLRFVSINENAGGAVVELAIENTDDLPAEKIEALTRSIKESAEKDIQILRNALKDRENEVKLLTGKVEGLKESIALILRDGRGNTFINNGQTGTMGDNSQAHDSSLNQIVNEENSSVGTQVQGERNIAIADASDSHIVTGDKNSIENE